MRSTAGTAPLRLALARATAWALLVAGWVGTGGLAFAQAPTPAIGFAWVALWLLALGGAATLATRGDLPRRGRALALAVGAALTSAALFAAVRGGGAALVGVVLGWALLTAVASGVVRALRLAQTRAPSPPVAPAGLGALVAGAVLGDLGDLSALALRLAALVLAAALVLTLLQSAIADRPRQPGCRAGLFDCSLPAWPTGAWREVVQWPTLLASLGMLPMMASLPLVAQWCRAESLAPQAAVLLHLAAMFGPPLLLRAWVARWSLRTLAAACTLLLVAGALVQLVAPRPYDLLGLTALHGAAWGLAWSGQLWAPARRGQQGASPWRAAAGYALLTLAFGTVVDRAGPQGVAAVHLALGVGAALAWAIASAMSRARSLGARRSS